MCGIAGLIDSNISNEAFIKAVSALSHRGPDGFGYFLEDRIALGHRRLSIIDTSDLGSQPYYFENLVLVFNGELYNYAEVRNELISQGYSFISNSDTEVLIKSFHKWREKAVEKFIGMFAFCIYDKTTKDLFLFRDRVGVKPLYYFFNNGLSFASEIKFFKSLPSEYTINYSAVMEYFKLGYITNENSIYNEINKLLPGHYLKYHNQKISINQYWAPSNLQTSFNDEKLVEEQLHELLISSFRYRMVADVPVGVFLSGGIDSSLVASILKKHHGQISTFTIGFNNKKYNEAPFAYEVAKHLGTDHHEFIMTEENAKDLLYNFYDIYDEPFSDSSGIPTTFISQLAKKNNIKVVLSADGGDELFCGYSHYNKIENRAKKYLLKNNLIKETEKRLLRIVQASGLLDKIYWLNIKHKASAHQSLLLSQDLIEFYQNSISNQGEYELEEMIKTTKKFKSCRFSYLEEKSAIENMAYWDMLHFLPDDLLVKMDRATMHVGIEGREPFLDHRLVEFAMNLPIQFKVKDNKNKYILKKILSHYIPENLFERPKKGFSIPIFQWFSGELNLLFKEFITREKLNSTNIFNTHNVLEEYKKFNYYKDKGQEYNIEKMWRILSFMMWWEKWEK